MPLPFVRLTSAIVTEPDAPPISREELQLAWRNRAMPLEALRYPLTPIGLHYVLVHYDVPFVDENEWQLRVDGAVTTPLELTMRELRAMPAETRVTTMECAGNGRVLVEPRPSSVPWMVEAVGTGSWTGVPLSHVLDAAGIDASVVELVFTGADSGIDDGVEQKFQRGVTIADATTGDPLLAYELNGMPLPPQHGFPLRLVVPGWYGMTNVKWLTAITAVTEPFAGYHNVHQYRLRSHEDEVGTPLSRMMVRSLMVPPGIPEFFTRARAVPAGAQTLIGRAWSGTGPIRSVAVSDDGGSTWFDADVAPPDLGPWAWQEWQARWHAQPGEHELCCRATDAAGNEQPLNGTWNLGGYANNSVQRITALVS
jgi:DMSO/TMAO reductase YedYZ molybdopterin-dependent catalytic subunit